MNRIILTCLMAFAILSSSHTNATIIKSEVVIVLDMSGSVYNSSGPDPFSNWQAELDFARDLIDATWQADGSVAFSLVAFAGCGPSFSFQQCLAQERLITHFDFNDTSIQNRDALLNYVNDLDSTDFKGGYTWTNEALGIAAELFQNSTNNPMNRHLVMLTDGKPFPSHSGHDVVDKSTGFESNNVQALKALGVVSNVISIIGETDTQNYIDFGDSFLNIGWDQLDFQSNRDSLLLPSAATNAAQISEPAALIILVIGIFSFMSTRKIFVAAKPNHLVVA